VKISIIIAIGNAIGIPQQGGQILLEFFFSTVSLQKLPKVQSSVEE